MDNLLLVAGDDLLLTDGSSVLLLAVQEVSPGVAEPTYTVYAHDGAAATSYARDGAGWAVWS